MRPLSIMTDDELAAHETSLRAKVLAGHNDGCREYLIATICERGVRDLDAARASLPARPEARPEAA